ncbi:MAG: cation diffusion facilitator family transporter [Methanosarcinaceae archaeon]|nr:cation diffusion facilitator family transporter [Methanosarcinaceae archaeon]
MSSIIKDKTQNSNSENLQESSRFSRAIRVTKLAMLVNICLTFIKFTAGILGHSSAMLADAVHSLSDLITDIAVIVGLRVSEKPGDSTHNYGHGKVETLAAAFIGGMLFLVGFEIFRSGLQQVLAVIAGKPLAAPGWIAFAAALLSVGAKEGLFRYTIKSAQALESEALAANAWHQRSDAFSSIGTLLGTGGAILLGGRWVVLDPLAALLLSYFIFKVAAEIFYKNINELLEASLPPKTCSEIEELIRSTQGVLGFHALKTRKIGNISAVDVHIVVDHRLNIVEAHQISENVEEKLKGVCGQNGYFSVHIDPSATSNKEKREKPA